MTLVFMFILLVLKSISGSRFWRPDSKRAGVLVREMEIGNGGTVTPAAASKGFQA